MTVLEALSRGRWFILAGIVMLVGYFVVRALPPRHLVIETGPVEGSYYRLAQEYAKRFAALGITLELRPRDDTLAIIDDVNDPAAGVDIGFVAQAVHTADYQNVSTLGSVAYQPLFVFYRSSLGALTKPTQMKGLRLELVAQRSATSGVATAILDAYGITELNTTLRHNALVDAVHAVKDGKSDAGFFVLAADNPLIIELADDPSLRLMSFDQAPAIAQRFAFLKPLTIAHGAFSLEGDRPPDDVQVVAATVDVIVRNDLPPAIVYTLLQFMMDLRGHGSGLAGGDDLPAVKNAQLPVSQFAMVYYQTGLPWVHRQLPLSLASLADSFLVFLLPLFVLLPIGQWLGMPGLAGVYSLLRTSAWMRLLQAIERDVDAGKPLTRHQLATLHVLERTLDPVLLRKYQCITMAARIREKHAAR